MQIVTALLAGVVFGAGLVIAQMVDPRKVLDFLDVAGIATGTWDPTLLMVFVGALPTMFAAYQVQKRWTRPVLAASFPTPVRQIVDARLVAGSAIFGLGWGLAGVCPGPAITGLALAGINRGSVLAFTAAMIVGVALSGLFKTGTSRVDASR